MAEGVLARARAGQRVHLTQYGFSTRGICRHAQRKPVRAQDLYSHLPLKEVNKFAKPALTTEV